MLHCNIGPKSCLMIMIGIDPDRDEGSCIHRKLNESRATMPGISASVVKRAVLLDPSHGTQRPAERSLLLKEAIRSARA